MPGCNEGLMPLVRRGQDGADSLAEERRLFYVSMTRAKQRLHLTHTWETSHYGRQNRRVGGLDGCAGWRWAGCSVAGRCGRWTSEVIICCQPAGQQLCHSLGVAVPKATDTPPPRPQQGERAFAIP